MAGGWPRTLGLEGTEAIVFRKARLKPGLELAAGDSRRPLSVGLRIIDYLQLDNPNR